MQLHGISAGPIATAIASGKECSFFIVIDKLQTTLDQRIEHWRKEEEERRRSFSLPKQQRKRQEIHTRMQIARSIAQAMTYLHGKKIVFRDIKPDNIGFDANGVLKLFDFGLAKELRPGMKQRKDGTYKLTANTGSRRYMAPEVAKGQSYNQSVDVYSFGILLWELCTLQKPFQGYSSAKHMQRVVMVGERPPMDRTHTHHWPPALERLMVRCWSPFWDARPDFPEVLHLVERLLEDDKPHPECPPQQQPRCDNGFGSFPRLLRNRTTGSAERPAVVGTRSRSWGFVR